MCSIIKKNCLFDCLLKLKMCIIGKVFIFKCFARIVFFFILYYLLYVPFIVENQINSFFDFFFILSLPEITYCYFWLNAIFFCKNDLHINKT